MFVVLRHITTQRFLSRTLGFLQGVAQGGERDEDSDVGQGEGDVEELLSYKLGKKRWRRSKMQEEKKEEEYEQEKVEEDKREVTGDGESRNSERKKGTRGGGEERWRVRGYW